MAEKLISRPSPFVRWPESAWSAERLTAAVPFVVIAMLVMVSISVFPLSEPDETRYAEISREMVVTGDWVTPRISGSPFVDKPPLLFWATAVAFKLGGIHPVTARIPVVASALACLMLTWWLARRLYDRGTAWFAALILSTSPLFFALGQHLVLDMPLAACVTLALVAVWSGMEAPSRGWIVAAWVALGLGVLAKGPVAAILVGGPVAVHLILQRDRSLVRTVLDPFGMVLAGLVAVPWFVAVEVENPGFLEIFIFRHHLQRFVDPWHHQQPWWHYLAALPLAMFPWSILAFLGTFFGKLLVAPSRWSPRIRFLVIWAGWTVLFFSLSNSKIVTYILPALPPLAILSARVVTKAVPAARSALGGTGLVLAASGFAVGLVVVAEFPSLYQDHGSFAIAIGTAAAGTLLLTGLGVTLLARLGLPRDAFAILTAGSLLFLGCAAAGRELATSYSELGSAVASLIRPGDLLVSYDDAVYGLALETAVETTFVRSTRHPDAGERNALWGERDAEWLVDRWVSNQRLFVLIDRDDVDSLMTRLDPGPRVLGRADDKVLLVNFPTGNPQAEIWSMGPGVPNRRVGKLPGADHSAGMPSTSITP